jgi:hypothetical protein
MAYNSLLQTLPGSRSAPPSAPFSTSITGPGSTGNPHVSLPPPTSATSSSTPTTSYEYPPLLRRGDYLQARFWDKSTFVNALYSHNPTTFRYSSSTARVQNTDYLEDENGTPLTEKRRGEMYSHARRFWTSCLQRSGRFPPTYRVLDLDTLGHFRSEMERHFSELRLCDNHWKADEIWIRNYHSWRSSTERQSGAVKTEACDTLDPVFKKEMPRKRKRAHSPGPVKKIAIIVSDSDFAAPNDSAPCTTTFVPDINLAGLAAPNNLAPQVTATPVPDTNLTGSAVPNISAPRTTASSAPDINLAGLAAPNNLAPQVTATPVPDTNLAGSAVPNISAPHATASSVPDINLAGLSAPIDLAPQVTAASVPDTNLAGPAAPNDSAPQVTAFSVPDSDIAGLAAPIDLAPQVTALSVPDSSLAGLAAPIDLAPQETASVPDSDIFQRQKIQLKRGLIISDATDNISASFDNPHTTPIASSQSLQSTQHQKSQVPKTAVVCAPVQPCLAYL